MTEKSLRQKLRKFEEIEPKYEQKLSDLHKKIVEKDLKIQES